MNLAPTALLLAFLIAPPALGQTSRPAPPKAPAALKVTAGESVRFVREASISVEVKRGTELVRRHSATFALTYGLEVQAVTKKRIVWALTIEKASGTESGKGDVSLGAASWKLEKPLTLQVASDRTGRLRGVENGRALLRFRQESGSAVATQYVFGDDPTAAGEPDGPLVFAPLLPDKPASSWTTKHGQAYGYLVADATRFRESWTWKTERGPAAGEAWAVGGSLTVEALEPLQEEVRVTPKVITSAAKVRVDTRSGLPISGTWSATFAIPVKKYGLTMTFRRKEQLDRAKPKAPATPKKKTTR